MNEVYDYVLVEAKILTSFVGHVFRLMGKPSSGI